MSHDNLSAVLDRIEDIAHNDPTPESLTLGEVIDSVGRRSYGALLLVIGLFAISPITVVPGLTWFAAAMTLVVAGQMAVGMPHIWLPKKALDLVLPRDVVKTGVRVSRRWAVRIDAILKPRLLFMSQPPFVNLVALLCISAALITFPLGLVPFGPIAPTLAIVFFGLGMVARDGVWLGLGMALLLAIFLGAKTLIFGA